MSDLTTRLTTIVRNGSFSPIAYELADQLDPRGVNRLPLDVIADKAQRLASLLSYQAVYSPIIQTTLQPPDSGSSQPPDSQSSSTLSDSQGTKPFGVTPKGPRLSLERIMVDGKPSLSEFVEVYFTEFLGLYWDTDVCLNFRQNSLSGNLFVFYYGRGVLRSIGSAYVTNSGSFNLTQKDLDTIWGKFTETMSALLSTKERNTYYSLEHPGALPAPNIHSDKYSHLDFVNLYLESFQGMYSINTRRS
jgi:hypothetical protein